MASGLVSATTVAAATAVGGLKPLDKMTKQEWRQQQQQLQQHFGDSEFSGSLCPIGGGAAAATAAAATRGYTSALQQQQQQQQQGLGHSQEAMSKAGGRSSGSGFIGRSGEGSRSTAPSRVSFESTTSSLDCPSTAFSSTSSSSSLSSEGPGTGSLAPDHESAAAAAAAAAAADSLLFGSPSASSFFPRAAATDSPCDSPYVSGVLARCRADSSLPSSVSCSPIRGARLAAATAGGSGGGSPAGAPPYGSSPLNPSPIAAAAAAGGSHRGLQRLPPSSLAATSAASGSEPLAPPCPVPLSGARNSYNKSFHSSMRSLSDDVSTSQKLPGSFFGQEQLLRATSVSGAARTSMAAADVEDNDVGGPEVGEGVSNNYHDSDGGDDVEIKGVQGICINIAEVEQQCHDMDVRNVALDGIVIMPLSRSDAPPSSFSSDSEPEPVRYTLTFTSSSRSGSSSGSHAGTETLSMPAPRPPSAAAGGMAAVAANAAAVAKSRAAAAGLASSGEASKQAKGVQRRSSGGSCADRMGKFGSSRRSTSRRDEDFSDYVLG